MKRRLSSGLRVGFVITLVFAQVLSAIHVASPTPVLAREIESDLKAAADVVSSSPSQQATEPERYYDPVSTNAINGPAVPTASALFTRASIYSFPK